MAGENRELDAKEISVGRLLHDGDYEFVIPEYQRPYAWGTEESLQLLADLVGALERDTDEPYFLGSIVLVKAPNAVRAEVIDGQQRLTTLTLLLAILRDLANDAGLREAIHKLIESPQWSGTIFPRARGWRCVRETISFSWSTYRKKAAPSD